MFYGIDLHSDNITVAAMGEEGDTNRVFKYQLGTEIFEKFLEHLNINDYMVVEASTNTFWFYEKVRYRVRRCIISDYFFAEYRKPTADIERGLFETALGKRVPKAPVVIEERRKSRMQ